MYSWRTLKAIQRVFLGVVSTADQWLPMLPTAPRLCDLHTSHANQDTAADWCWPINMPEAPEGAAAAARPQSNCKQPAAHYH